MGLVPPSLYLRSPVINDDEQHLPAYCTSPSPESSPLPRTGTVYTEAENAHIAVLPTAQAHANTLGEKRGNLNVARNWSAKYDMLSRSDQSHTRPGAQRSATATTRQEFFRPPGYTSAAPWLRSDQSQQSFAWGDGRPYPYPQPDRRRATTGSTYIAGTPSHAVLELSREGTIVLPNPYGHPPLGHRAENSRVGTLSDPLDDGDMWPAFLNPVSLPLTEHINRDAPCVELVQHQPQFFKAQLRPQYGGHLQYMSTPPQDGLPEVAITESRLILGGVDVYADMHPRDMTTNAKGSDTDTYAEPCLGTPARTPLLANGTQTQERRIISQRPTANPDSLHFHSHPPQLYTAGQLNRPLLSALPLNFIATQPSPHPGPSASILFNESKPPFVRRDTPAGGMLHKSRCGSASHKNPKNIPINADGTREWSSDLCMFCDHNLGACLAALVCPCIVYAQNKARLEHLNLTETPLKARAPQALGDGNSTFNGDRAPRRDNWCFGWATRDCAIHACLTIFCLFGWAMQISNRAATRRRYDIEGDLIGDCAAALCCSSCELVQESREIALEERSYYGT